MAGYDVVVVGLGAIGSAALHRVVRRGQRVLGIEQFEPGHDRGSSHGDTRVFRLGYFEHPSYVPLLREAQVLWRELESESRRRLLTTTGIIEIGAADGPLVSGTLASSRLHGLPHEVLTAEAMQRFPAFAVPPDYVGVYQPDGGFLAAEASVLAQIECALAAGAEIRTQTKVQSIEPYRSGVRIVTSCGSIDAGAVIIAAGAWLKTLVPQLGASLRVTRQVLGWLSPPAPDLFSPAKLPVFLFENRGGLHYGFPIHDARGLKIARHHHLDEEVDPERYDRTIYPADEAEILPFCRDYLPAARGPLTSAKTCLYTMTPDGDFLVDRLRGAPQIIVASPCSGHGFKFAPVIGDILADLATTGSTHRDISRFSLARFD
jgi:sarcosine oxidase